MNLFTWYDAEIELKKNKDLWPRSWNRIDVYNDEVIINIDKKLNKEEENEATLENIFGKNYIDNSILIDFDKTYLEIIYEEGDADDKIIPIKMPLFKDIYTKKEKKEKKNNLQGTPIIAFHSYKGGVGRTLSLISLAKEISELYGNEKKLLIIDADIEAPGLTWMLGQGEENAPISYLDVLSLMHFHNIDTNLADSIARLIEKSTLTIETERLEVEQYFLPVYRKKEQVMNVFSNPEKIITVQDNKYIITEFISMIGAALKADYVLVDLRAGITEFSAPFLFDARVQKYFVSSTSMQSVVGIQQILEEIYRRESFGLRNSKILLTMIPREMENETILRIEDKLTQQLESEIDSETAPLRESYLIRILFESPLISLGNFGEICAILRGKEISKIMESIAKGLFERDAIETENILSVNTVRDTLSKLNKIAISEMTAEGNASSNMLSTSSIREIVKDYKDSIPQIVVLGAKGSGKTYIYKQMILKQTWEDFVKIVDKNVEQTETETLIFPLLPSVNLQYINKLAQECIQNVRRILDNKEINLNSVNDNYDIMMRCSEKELQLTEWRDIWRKLLINALGKRFSNLTEIDEYLESKRKKIVFLIDGLEDLFMNTQTQKQENWKFAIRALCQNVVNDLRNLKFGNVGIIVFARKDMAEEAIEINFEQFKNQYSRYELKWTPTEALRLALWIASQASPVFGDNIDILKSSREVLEERLELLWGKKLGRRDSREAISARWIIAALSDFTGQLQARDIVRFLKFATNNLPEGKLAYPDRYIMPLEIRKAIPDCSVEKFVEVKSEMKAVYKILKKFEDMDEGNKQLPLTLDKIHLTGEEIARLENQGYLVTSDKKYYLPEIIRFALGFKYEKGARPKVLSLLAK